MNLERTVLPISANASFKTRKVLTVWVFARPCMLYCDVSFYARIRPIGRLVVPNARPHIPLPKVPLRLDAVEISCLVQFDIVAYIENRVSV